MSQAVAAPTAHPIARRWDVVVLAAALVYFVARAGFYALNIAPGVPPDESAHFGISEVFAKTWRLPQDSSESYKYGVIAHSPSLYYYLMGRVANANFLFESDLRWLRLANIVLGALTVVYGYLWMRLFTTNRIARSLFVVMVTNIPMFTFLSASVSYDNLANLLAAMSLYYLALFFAVRRPAQLGGFFVAILLGSLTKYTFLPLAAMLTFLLLVHEWKEIGKLPRRAARLLRPFTLRRMALPAAVLALAAANLMLYGENCLRYRRPIPLPQQVLSLDQCLQNPVFARDFIANAYRHGQMTLPEALKAAGRINDDGIKAALAEMLTEAMRQEKPKRQNSTTPKPPHREQNPPPPKKATSFRLPLEGGFDPAVAAVLQETPAASAKLDATTPVGQSNDDDSSTKTGVRAVPLMSRARYASLWIGQMAETTFRILAQFPAFRTDAEFRKFLESPETEKLYPPNPAFKSELQFFVYGAIFALAILLFVVTQSVPAWRRARDFGGAMSATSTAMIALAYVLLMFWFNYGNYTETGLAALAVQGRYLFPALVPTYGLAACLLVCCCPRRQQAPVALLTAAWFIYGDFPFALPTLTPHWFA